MVLLRVRITCFGVIMNGIKLIGCCCSTYLIRMRAGPSLYTCPAVHSSMSQKLVYHRAIVKIMDRSVQVVSMNIDYQAPLHLFLIPETFEASRRKWDGIKSPCGSL